MKYKISLFALCLFCCVILHAAEKVSVKIVYGIGDAKIKSQVETTISDVLIDLKSPELNNLRSKKNTEHVINKILQYQRFYSVINAEKDLVCSADARDSVITVRNVPVFFVPKDTMCSSDTIYCEMAFTFDSKGQVSDFGVCLTENLVNSIICPQIGIRSQTYENRCKILRFVEKIKDSLLLHDKNFVDSLFDAEHTLIAERGKKLTSKRNSAIINHFFSILTGGKNSKVMIDDVECIEHPAKLQVYGLSMHVTYQNRSDLCGAYFFFLIDIYGDELMIHVIGVSPDSPDGKRMPKDEIFRISDFDI